MGECVGCFRSDILSPGRRPDIYSLLCVVLCRNVEWLRNGDGALLATEGVDVNSKDSNGRTPLMWAERHEAVVKLLLEAERVDAC